MSEGQSQAHTGGATHKQQDQTYSSSLADASANISNPAYATRAATTYTQPAQTDYESLADAAACIPNPIYVTRTDVYDTDTSYKKKCLALCKKLWQVTVVLFVVGVAILLPYFIVKGTTLTKKVDNLTAENRVTQQQLVEMKRITGKVATLTEKVDSLTARNMMTQQRMAVLGRIIVQVTSLNEKVDNLTARNRVTQERVAHLEQVCMFPGCNVTSGDAPCETPGGSPDGTPGYAPAAAWLPPNPSWVVDSAGSPRVTHDAGKALDGDVGSYWNPTGAGKGDWFIVLDLKQRYTLTRIAVNNYGDHTHDVKTFKLQTSQIGSPYSWEDVVTVDEVTASTSQRQEFGGFQATARYWKFIVTRTHSYWQHQPWLKGLNLYGVQSGISAGPSTQSVSKTTNPADEM